MLLPCCSVRAIYWVLLILQSESGYVAFCKMDGHMDTERGTLFGDLMRLHRRPSFTACRPLHFSRYPKTKLVQGEFHCDVTRRL